MNFIKEHKISGAIFDMDGTLLDSLMFWDLLWERLGELYLGGKKLIPDPVTAKSVRTTTIDVSMCTIYRNCGVGESEEQMSRLGQEMLRDFYIERAELKPGAREFLKHIRECGIKACLASASEPEMLDIIVKKHSLKEYLPDVVSCREVGKGKDSPDVFILANERLGTPKDETWIFEDSITALKTAKDAGYKIVGVYDKYTFEPEGVEAVSDVYLGCDKTYFDLIK